MVKRTIEPPNYDKTFEESCRGPWQINYQKLHEDVLRTKKGILLFRCPTFSGWGNRIRALLSSFHLAVISKRAFIIDCPKPSPLEKYLEPNFIKWNYQINTTDMSFRSRHYDISPFATFWKYNNFEIDFNHSVEEIYNYGREFYLRHNPKYYLPTWRQEHMYFGCCFHFLFKKTKRLENRMAQAKEQLGFDRNIVLGIHIRRGDVFFHHHSSRDVRIHKVENAQYHFDCAEMIDQRIQKLYKTKKIIWFFASDCVEIKKYAEERYPNRIKQLHGKIEHTSWPREGNEDAGHMSMFLDYFLLQQSDFRLFTTASSFSNAVSMLTEGPYSHGRSTYKNNITKCDFPRSLKT